MSLDLSRSLLIVRALHADGGPEAGAWERTPQGDTGWHVLTAPGGAQVVCYRANTDPGATRGLFAIFGPPAVLSAIEATADLAMPAAEAWRRRAEAAVLLYLRSWPTFLCAGFERDADGNPVAFSGVRQLLDPGGRLPDYTVTPLPWNLAADGRLTTQALARYRVTSIARPALGITLAGLGCNDLFDAEPDSGA
jgi:hypothetical protein